MEASKNSLLNGFILKEDFSFHYLLMLAIENQTAVVKNQAVMNLPIKLICNVMYSAQQALS